MKIQLVNLSAQYLSIKNEIDSSINDVINETAFIKGKYLKIFEEKFAKANNVKFCIGVGNGTDAYNAYRRTGLPSDVQPNIEPNPGAFPVSMWYPNNYTARNSNASQKSDLTGKVFWNTQSPNLK